MLRMRGGLDEQGRTETIDRFALDPRKKARTYSKGNRQKATVLVAALGALLVMVLMGLGLAVGYGLGMGDWGQVVDQMVGQLSYLPAVLVMAALTLAILGPWPRWSSITWGTVAFVFLQVTLEDTLRLPGWVDGISPFWHLPRAPVHSFEALPVAAELALVAVLVLVGLWGYRRRDLGAS